MEKGSKIVLKAEIFTPPTLETIYKEHRVDMEFLKEQYELGSKEELEHTPDIELAEAIALHHLSENPNYYIILRKALEEDEANKLEGYYAKGGSLTCEQLDENGERKIDMESIEDLTQCVTSLPQTKSMHFDYETNKYTQERHRLHKDIIYNIKKDVVCINDDQPIAILMGGSPASGKTTFLKKYSPYLLNEEILKIDADDIRSKLPEYKGYNATQTHLETKDIVNTLLSDRNIGLPCKFDVIYDGTMNSTKSYIPLITLLKDLGYKVFIVYIDKVQKDVIVKRALERYKKSGRFVPLEIIDDFFDKGTSAMEQLKFMVDGYMIIDGSSTNYKILTQGGMRLPKKRNYSKIGQPIQITENDIITEFKKGGELDPDNTNIKKEITHKSGSAGGMLVGNRHSEGGIKAINNSTNQPLEMEGGEVVITRNAVSDDQKREFEGKMLTNRQILSKINESGGGVSFADGGNVPEYIMTSGKEYKYGGKTMKDSEIVSSCGCQHKMKEGGYMDDGITTHEFMHLKYGHKLLRDGDLLIINKVVPSFFSFSKYNESLHPNQLKETYKSLLNREYEINFDELPHAIKGALMIGNQKMIDNYINQ
jgi:predicted ABC-type ATPase